MSPATEPASLANFLSAGFVSSPTDSRGALKRSVVGHPRVDRSDGGRSGVCSWLAPTSFCTLFVALIHASETPVPPPKIRQRLMQLRNREFRPEHLRHI